MLAFSSISKQMKMRPSSHSNPRTHVRYLYITIKKKVKKKTAINHSVRTLIRDKNYVHGSTNILFLFHQLRQIACSNKTIETMLCVQLLQIHFHIKVIKRTQSQTRLLLTYIQPVHNKKRCIKNLPLPGSTCHTLNQSNHVNP